MPKITELAAAATPLAGTEQIPLVQSAATRRVAISELTSGLASSLTAHTGNLANPHGTTAAQVGAAAVGAITSSGLTMATARLLGRTTASTGAVQEISIGTGLTLSAGSLSASVTSTPGGSSTQVQYNNAGAFAGTAGFTFDAANVALNANAFRLNAASINAQTGTGYTLFSTDNGRVVTLNNAGAITVTVPSGLGLAFSCTLIQLGTGQVTLTAGAGVTINGPGGVNKTATRYSAITLLAISENVYVLSGDAA